MREGLRIESSRIAKAGNRSDSRGISAAPRIKVGQGVAANEKAADIFENAGNFGVGGGAHVSLCFVRSLRASDVHTLPHPNPKPSTKRNESVNYAGNGVCRVLFFLLEK